MRDIKVVDTLTLFLPEANAGPVTLQDYEGQA